MLDSILLLYHFLFVKIEMILQRCFDVLLTANRKLAQSITIIILTVLNVMYWFYGILIFEAMAIR